MKAPTAGTLFSIMRLLNWDGHVEMGDKDLKWLAQEIFIALSPKGDTDLCEVCESLQPIVLKTTLGRICENCLNSMSEEAEDMRDQLEGD